MSPQDDDQAPDAPNKAGKAAEKFDRQAAALRANLRRRQAQRRAQAGQSDTTRDSDESA